MSSGVYIILNILDGRYYVGSSKNIQTRWGDHRRDLNNGVHHNPRLQNTWSKYGKEIFEFHIIISMEGREKLLRYEQILLDIGFSNDALYNIALCAASSMQGRSNPHTPEWNQKISDSNKGKQHTQETKQILRMRALEWYKTHEGPFKGKKHTEETCYLLSLKRGEDHHCWGVPKTEEQNQKNSKAKLKYYEENEFPEYVKQKISIANSKPHPPFYNIITEEYIPVGINVSKLSRDTGINFSYIKSLAGKVTRLGWKVVIDS